MFVPSFLRARESWILNCHHITAEDIYHRIKGEGSYSSDAIPRDKSL